MIGALNFFVDYIAWVNLNTNFTYDNFVNDRGV
jgi:hypothetical protein